ncbi:alpha/beta hydrolase [Streptomyces sp. NBC_00267]|uniref:alpha/beta hydrolase n=1 Tax=unclassified Streptomyces TaxID=2593676 RepID=UPI003FA6AF0C
MPPADIEVGQLDVFRDEDTAYATKLSRAGVLVEFHLRPGAPHEFDSIAFTSDVARRAITDRIRVLKSIRAATERARPMPQEGYAGAPHRWPAPRCPARWSLSDTGTNTLKHRAAGPESHFAQHAHLRPGDCRTPFDPPGT